MARSHLDSPPLLLQITFNMKQQQFRIITGLAGLALLLALWVIFKSISNRSLEKSYNEALQAEVQKQAPQVQKGPASEKIGGEIIKDMAAVALQNPAMKDVLAKHGYTVNPAPTPTPAPGVTPTTKPTPDPSTEAPKQP